MSNIIDFLSAVYDPPPPPPDEAIFPIPVLLTKRVLETGLGRDEMSGLEPLGFMVQIKNLYLIWHNVFLNSILKKG